MNLIDRARIDTQTITSNPGEFATPVIFTSLTDVTVTVNCIVTTHHTGLDEFGNRINSKMASLSVAESKLIEQNYPVRDSKNYVSLMNHKVVIIDSNNVSKKYIIREYFPDETFGVITCVLGEFKD